ncbi:hypothetical protein QZH41_020568 [Actinostola sp. cb2023]|nr:hypothetical protein QZH41_020568 [Actinostola sp. cb2023]
MSTDIESICCQEIDVLNKKFDDSGVDCITKQDKFEIVCLDSDVLKTALVSIHNVRSTPQPDTVHDRFAWRLSAYRQFTSWTHGFLGKRNRRPIPSRVVRTIRDKFPEESGIPRG